MRATIELGPLAEDDLFRIVDFIFEQSAASAWSFVDAYEATLQLLRDFPQLGIEWDGYRRLLIGQSGYRLIYALVDGVVRIVRVEHARTPHPF